MGGKCSSKCTSTTAPMTWVMCPTGLAMDGPCYCTEIRVCGSSHRLGAGDDLDQLFGDHRLTSAVVGQCLFADHLAGVALEHGRNDLLSRRDLGDDRLETRKEQSANVERAILVEPQDLVANFFGVFEAKLTDGTQFDVLDNLLLVHAAKLFVALAAHAEELDLLAFRYERIRSLARKAHDRRVERSAQAALGGAYQQKMRPFLTSYGQKWRRCAEVADPGSDITEHLYHLMGIGARGLGRSLGAPQLRCRDHLHGLGDLLRRLGGGDAHAHVLETGHGR